MGHIDELTTIIHILYGATAAHQESVPVKETFHGRIVWEGFVEVFHLSEHPHTNTVYAWFHDTGETLEPVTMLHIHRVLTPLAAVRAFLVQEYRNAIAETKKNEPLASPDGPAKLRLCVSKSHLRT